MSNSITQWLTLLEKGDEQAAEQIWGRYYARLIRLARKKLGEMPRRCSDEEDVVLNAFDSFFRCAEQGRFPRLTDRHDLWQILVMLTARKAARQIEHDLRQKRGWGQVQGETALKSPNEEDERQALDNVVGTEPTPELAAMLVDKLQEVLEALPDESFRTVTLLKLEGYSNGEVADRLRCTQRTIERKLKLIREIWGNIG